MRTIVIRSNDANQRLDRFLAKYLPKAPMSLLQKWIRAKRIKRNQKRTEPQAMLVEGDTLQFYLYEEVLRPYERGEERPKGAGRLVYRYQDEQMAVIDKPAGILSHAASRRDYGHNVVDAFTADLLAQGSYVPRREASFRPAIVNRLDQGTEGLIIGAKTHHALVVLSQSLRERRIQKAYQAVCVGCLEAPCRIEARLAREGKRARVASTGREAITVVRPLQSNGRYTLLDIDLETGRFHQIRAHLASLGHPLVGDRRYGGSAAAVEGAVSPMLIAYRLTFAPLDWLPNGLVVESGRLDTFLQRAARLLEGGK